MLHPPENPPLYILMYSFVIIFKIKLQRMIIFHILLLSPKYLHKEKNFGKHPRHQKKKGILIGRERAGVLSGPTNEDPDPSERLQDLFYCAC